MLAQNFKSAEELELTGEEVSALVQVLGMLEREEIAPEQFNMATTGEGCGTPACVLGWVRRIHPTFRRTSALSDPLLGLFAMSSDEHAISRVGHFHRTGRTIPDITPAEAAVALRNFLTTGAPNWTEALSS